MTCYGDVAATAMSENKAAAEAAGAEVTDRSSGGGAYDVDNPSTSSTTTIFRVGPLIGQIADAGSASPADLEAITKAVAAAMGDDRAAGAPGAGASDAAVGSDEPLPSRLRRAVGVVGVPGARGEAADRDRRDARSRSRVPAPTRSSGPTRTRGP